jgi:phenylalanine-4-hydroxylase
MVQEYEKYTADDHKVWSLLYDEQMRSLPSLATQAFLDGTRKVKFQPTEVPRFDVVNEELANITGWKLYVVPGYVSNKPFFTHLSNKEFPVTTWLRKLSEFDYLPEPDMFHDVFGHVPLLSERFFCDYLEGISRIGLKYIENESAVELVSRVYWFTVEFGLIRENGELRIYGAGILSSPGESKFSVSDKATHLPFDVDRILETPYIKEKYQESYFVIDSYQQLFESLPAIERAIDSYVERGIYVEPNK